jgi:uncharacterized membrane protein YccC
VIGWLALTVYLIGFVVVARKGAMAVLNDELRTSGHPDPFDRAFARFIGIVIGALWPLVVAGALITGRLPKTTRELEAELRDRDRRIAQLERELGVGQ